MQLMPYVTTPDWLRLVLLQDPATAGSDCVAQRSPFTKHARTTPTPCRHYVTSLLPHVTMSVWLRLALLLLLLPGPAAAGSD
jgi:hypothetical protein